MTVCNAKITGTMLGIEDHGILTFFVFLEGKGWGQGLGGFALDQYKDRERDGGERESIGAGLAAIRKILETVGVEKWENLPGTLIRVERSGLGSSVPPRIGHILEDRWFDLGEFMAKAAKP